MKLLIILTLLTGLAIAQESFTPEDKTMSDHVMNVWKSATEANYKTVFDSLITDCENYLKKYPNTNIKPGLLGYLFEMKATLGRPHDSIIKSVDSLLAYDRSEYTLIRVSKVLIQRQIDIDKAIEILKPIFADTKNKSALYDANLLMAAAEMHRKDIDSAINYLKIAVNIDSTREDAYRGLEQAYKSMGKTEDSEKISEKITELKTDKNIGVSLSNFSINDIEGEKISLKDYKGKIVALVFFSFDCPYCKKELPVIKDLISKYPEVKFLFINLNESEAEIKDKFLKEDEFLFLSNQTIIKFSDEFDKILDITITPQFLIVDKNSVVKYDYRGFEKDLETKFAKNINALK